MIGSPGPARPRRVLCVAALVLAGAAAGCGSKLDEARREALLDEADRALESGRLAEAEESFARVHRSLPADARALFGLGLAKLRQGKASEALKPLGEAVALDPANGHYAYIHAQAIARSEPTRALEALQAVVTAHPDHMQATASLIDALWNAGRGADAMGAAAAAAGRWPRRYDVAMVAAQAHARAGERSEALAYFEAARRIRPYAPEAVAGIVMMLRDLGRSADAQRLTPFLDELRRREAEVAALGDKARADSGDPAASRAFVERLFMEGRFEQAADQTEIYLRQFPGDTHGGGLALRAAQACALFGDPEGARRFLGEIGALGHRSNEEITAVAEVHAALGDFEEALGTYELVLMERPDDPRVLLGLGRVAMKTGRVERAEPALRRAVQIQPRSAAAHVGLGLLLARKGEAAAAREALERALGIEPDNAEALFGLGYLEHQERRREEAERHLRAALRRQPDHAPARAILALVLSETGRCEEAIPLFTRSLEGDYKNLALHAGLIRCYEDSGRLAEAAAARRIAAQLLGDQAVP
ncbi:MAG TPA: tetratricopeptide repeat protein [Candidatus Polarisedimenticolia bacterium]|nr:tetratricopeptide repeat protein [Candidatus Polarisedimenticolia bacterium]